MRHLTFHSTLGRRSPKREEISAKVRVKFIWYKKLITILFLFIGLLEKSRHKRPGLEEVLNHPWFADFADIHKMRKDAVEGQARFMAYTLTEPNSPKIQDEIDKYGAK